jgi:hypothetical protein
MSDTDLLFDTREIEVKKVEKKKRVLSQKQLDNLAKGRLKMKEKRDLKKIENEKKGLLKKEKVAVTKNVSIKRENKINKKNLKKIQQEAMTHRDKLIQNKQRKEQAEKLSKFDDLKSKWLLKTETIEDYDLVKTELDTIPEDTILDDDKLELSLLDIMKKYKGDELE